MRWFCVGCEGLRRLKVEESVGTIPSLVWSYSLREGSQRWVGRILLCGSQFLKRMRLCRLMSRNIYLNPALTVGE